MRIIVVAIGLCALAACQNPGVRDPRGGGKSINPSACGTLDATPVAKKLHAFLEASADLERSSVELEASVHATCRRMADLLGVSPNGTTKDVCVRVAKELDANLKVSVKTESRLVTRFKPPECHTEIDFAAGIVAKCEAKVSADVGVRCSGRCSGTCTGECQGKCGEFGDAASCEDTCSGTCKGRCSGRCDGYAEVDASAECKASAEVRANLRTECSEPKIEVVQENVTVVDDSKFKKAIAAINAGLPQLLRATRKLELASKAIANWVQTGASLARSSGELISDLGTQAVCVGGQLAAVVAATADIQARFSVSIEVSAQVSASCGATAN
jgi:hypothetical protein